MQYKEVRYSLLHYLLLVNCIANYDKLIRIPAKFTKLKLIEHFSYVTLVTPTYSQSMVLCILYIDTCMISTIYLDKSTLEK